MTAGRQQLALPSIASRLSAVLNCTSTLDLQGYNEAQVSLVLVVKSCHDNLLLAESIAVSAFCLGCLPHQTATARLGTDCWSDTVKGGILWGL